jgi:co-chaperonin GroES (HSP10)
MRPNGDRYLCEILPVDEEKLSSGLFLPEAGEEKKGWAVGVVFAIGNGHRLERPDTYVALAEKYECDPDFDPDINWGDSRAVRMAKIEAGQGATIDHGDNREERIKKQQARMQRRQQIVANTNIAALGDNSMVLRYPAGVPMFFALGEVVFIEKYSGRPVVIEGREFRFVNQVDVLGSSGRFLKLGPDGVTWEERDLKAEQEEFARNAALRGQINGSANKRIVMP